MTYRVPLILGILLALSVAVFVSRAQAQDQTAQAVKVQPKTLKAYDVNRAMNQLKQSNAYKQAIAATEKKKLDNAEFSVLVGPGNTASGQACICIGGSGEINGKPVDWGCFCDPAGCGSCGGADQLRAPN